MSKFQETYSGEGYKCPYCGYTPQAEGSDYTYDGETVECEECGKKFAAQASHEVTFFAYPNCALNGEKHDWEIGERYARCKICDKLALLDENGKVKE